MTPYEAKFSELSSLLQTARFGPSVIAACLRIADEERGAEASQRLCELVDAIAARDAARVYALAQIARRETGRG